MTIRALIREGEMLLAQKQMLSPKLDSEYLLAEALHVPRLNLLLSPMDEVSEEAEKHYRSLLTRRANHEPLQYLLGTEDFFGLTFRVTPHVLIPRADTETLCEKALEVLPENGRVLDLCTGSGALATAIAHTRKDARVSASDLSTDALMIAQENAASNHVHVTFYQGDLFEPLAGLAFDVIVSNPPYISGKDMPLLQPEVKKEPEMALYGGEDGLDFYRRIVQEAPQHLSENGWLCLEIGDTQAPDVMALMAEDFEMIACFQDLSGRDRVVRGRRKK
ncbi:MAG: peptide chain release factor N(5)-glutamine methyltransferase [Clostridia bacterium]|nr:peptide chain release factor N(5)-glutamine methyltransferase [Clostridia bacterium]